MIRHTLWAVSVLLLICGCKPTIHKENVIFIRSKSVKVGIVPSIGGTAVYLGKDGSPNILLSDTSLWNLTDSARSVKFSNGSYIPVGGHTVWLGPQAGWWLQQNSDTLLKRQKAEWPPDPYLSSMKYNIIERSDELLGVIGPESPYTGIQLEKEIRVNPRGLVTNRVLAKNIRPGIIRWDLWFNTRIHAYDRCYVPVLDSSSVIVDNGNDSVTTGFSYRIQDGFFTYLPEAVPEGLQLRKSRAHIYPSKNYIATFCNKYLLIIRFPNYPIITLHPAESLVEISLQTSSRPDEEYMELGHHTPYETLKPGQVMSGWETWEIIEYPGSNDRDEQTAFLRNIGL